MGKKASDRRVVLEAGAFAPAEILALSKLCDPKSKDVIDARGKLKPSVWVVDVTVRVTGDIEVGVSERVPDKLSLEKHLVAALSMLGPAQRKKVLSRTPGGSRGAKILAAAELKAFKTRLPKHAGPAKLTPHLTVARLDPRPLGMTT